VSPQEIVGVVLVRNEDRFLEAALRNVSGFCDRFLFFDHNSTDLTHSIFEAFARKHDRAELHRVSHPSESQKALHPFAGKDVWVFGVDGDEIYDPAGLARLKPRILCGEFKDSWMLMGHCHHTENLSTNLASGYLAPPSRSVTKLYNFGAIDAWPGASMERLHGGSPVFRPGFDATKKRLLFNESSWEDSPLRCLHLCFCRRSSLDQHDTTARKNVDEIYNRPNWFSRLQSFLQKKRTGWKHEHYRRGPLIEVSTLPFFDAPV
jgi:hypothetical protein